MDLVPALPRVRAAVSGLALLAAALLPLAACSRGEPLPENRIAVAYVAPAETIIARPYAAVVPAARAALAAAGCTVEAAAEDGGGTALRVREREYDGARYWIYQPSITIVSDAVRTDAGRRPYRWRVVDLRYPDGVACLRHDEHAKPYETATAAVDAESFTLPYVDGCVLAAAVTLHLAPAGDGATRLRLEVVSARGPYRETAYPGGAWRAFLARADLASASGWQAVLPARSWLARTFVEPLQAAKP